MMIRQRGNGFYDCGDLIKEMLCEGYDIEEINIDGKIISGEDIKLIDFLTYISIELLTGRILFVPYEKINWITLKEVDGYE